MSKWIKFFAPYQIVFFPMILLFLSISNGGFWTFSVPVFIFFLIPVLDFFVGEENEKYSLEAGQFFLNSLVAKKALKSLLILYVIFFALLLFYFLSQISLNRFSIVEISGITLPLGLIAGNGINVAHELTHKQDLLPHSIGMLFLLLIGYPHFATAHKFGHHRNIGTKDDYSTSRLNENFYEFFIRTLKECYSTAWKIEETRLKTKSGSSTFFKNRIFLDSLAVCLLTIFIGYQYGLHAIAAFFVQAMIAIVTLEAVSFIEHYGLLRRKLSNGKYEKVSAYHSWNSNKAISNFFLLKLQHHSDHHFSPTKWFFDLRNDKRSPSLPFGYPVMIMFALTPLAWRRLMDERVLSARQTLSQAVPLK